MKLKTALIGIGGMGSCHFGIYKDMENIDLTAVCDVRADVLSQKTEGCALHRYTDFDELLAKEKPDIIDICTPSYLHKEQVIKALNAGVNVLCEKPMALNDADAEEIENAAKKSDKLFMVAHVVRFMNAYIYLKNTIESKKYGRLLHLDMKRLSSIPLWSFENWMLDKEKSGHVLMDLMIHDIDFVQSVLGSPTDISGVYYDFKDLTNYAVVNYIYDNLCVSVQGAWHKADIPFSAGFRAVFENGSLDFSDNVLSDCGERVDFTSADTIGKTDINISDADGYGREIAYFADCVKNGTAPGIVTPQSSRESIKLAERTLKKLTKI